MAKTPAQLRASRNYYQRNKEKILADSKSRSPEKRARHNEICRASYSRVPLETRKGRWAVSSRKYVSTPRGFAARMLANAKTNSRKRGMATPTLTREWIIDEINKGCSLTGLPLVVDGPPHHSRAPSLDRMDNSRPYTLDNTRIVCWAINMGLGTWGTDEYARVAQAFLEHAKKSTTILQE